MRRALQRLGAVQIATASRVGNAATLLLCAFDAARGKPLSSWPALLRFIGWGT